MAALQKRIINLILAITLILVLFKIIYSNKSVPTTPIKLLKSNDDDFVIPDKLLSNTLVNFTEFKYKIKNTQCHYFKEELLGIIIVTSYVGHDVIRSAHRQSISQKDLKRLGLLRIFLLAAIPENEKFIEQKAIIDEQSKFDDLLQGNFLEAYKNLTYKHIMGLKWASEDCNNAKYIVKVDDDSVFDVYHLQNYLMDLEYSSGRYLLAGFVLANKKPIRVSASKWFVSKSEFSDEKYPPYLSGWLYITNPKTAHDLVWKSQTENFFWIDDTFVTGILAEKFQIRLLSLNKWYSANSQFLDCCIKDMSRFQLKCDYHIGPNGGDNKMIIDFNREVKKCYESGCSDRSPESSLYNTCIGQIKDIVKDHGNAVIQEIKL